MDDPILQDLRQAYASGNLIVFAGAGVSAGVGLPTWKQLAEKLRDRVRRLGGAPAAVDEINQLIAGNQLINALSAAKLALGAQEFNITVEKALDDTGRDIPEVARAIADLKPKLRAVLTTNIDRFLERAFQGEWDVVDRATGDVASRRSYIFKLHGSLRAWDTWVFSRDQYDRAIFGSPLLQDAFGALYRTHPILFVGCGLADDNLDQTLFKVRALSGGQPPMHFALMAKGIPPFRRRSLEEAGLRLIIYENADGDHAEVVEILRDLDPSAAAARAAAAVPVVALPKELATMSVNSRMKTVRPGGAAATPVRVFFCYAPEDQALFAELEKHLSLLRRQGLIAGWSTGQIHAGEEMESAIRDQLDAADLIVMLFSTDFLASEESDAQVSRALERRAAGRATVVPILLRPSEWKDSRLGALQPLPRNGVPVTKWSDRDEAFLQIAKELRAVVSGIRR